MKKVMMCLIALILIISSAAADETPPYLGSWVCIFHTSQDSTTFVMFQLRDDHTVLYSNQFFYIDHAGMAEKGVWKWEEINDHYFRILTDDGRLLYFELTDKDYLAAGYDIYYTRFIAPEAD